MFYCLLLSFFSLIVIVLLAQDCSTGTVSNRPTGKIIGTSQLSAQDKLKGRQIMNPAFQNAGRRAGLEIWRIEVSHKIHLIPL